MECSDITDLNRKALRRIVALLCALALLAERASFRSQAVRWSVLFFLAPGEIVARAYVATVTGNLALNGPSLPIMTLHAGDRPEDAMRLAQAFRMLAASLAAFLDSIDVPSQVDVSCAGLAAAVRNAARATAAAGVPTIAAERRDSS